MFVADVLKYDIETVSSILKLLNDKGCLGWRFCRAHDFTEEEVVPALRKLVSLGMVRALQEGPGELEPATVADFSNEQFPKLWFELRKKGRDALNRWDPPLEERE